MEFSPLSIFLAGTFFGLALPFITKKLLHFFTRNERYIWN